MAAASYAAERRKCLAFASAYLGQARLDIANGFPEWAPASMASRRHYQTRLAALRAGRVASL